MSVKDFIYQLTKFATLPPKIKQFGDIYKCPNCGARLLEPKPNQVTKCLFCGLLVRS